MHNNRDETEHQLSRFHYNSFSSSHFTLIFITIIIVRHVQVKTKKLKVKYDERIRSRCSFGNTHKNENDFFFVVFNVPPSIIHKLNI